MKAQRVSRGMAASAMPARRDAVRPPERHGTPAAAAASPRSPAHRPLRAPMPQPVQRVLRTEGEPLPMPLQREMGPRFGADFSDVRVHTGAAASAAAEAVQALAFAIDAQLVFGRGEYDPQSPQGRRLIAHELAHVVQQKRGTGPVACEPHANEDAQAAASAVIDGDQPRVAARTEGGALMREPTAFNPADALPAGLLGDLRKQGLAGADPAAPLLLNVDTGPAAVPALARGWPWLPLAGKAAKPAQRGPPAGAAQPKAAAPLRGDAAPPLLQIELLPLDAPTVAPDATLPFDVGALLKGGLPPAARDPNEVVFVGDPATRPSWTRGMRLWTDAQGRTSIWTADAGTTTWTREGKQIGLKAPDQEKVERALRSTLELSQTGGLRYVEGKGWLAEEQWKAYTLQRAKELSCGAQGQVDELKRGNVEWAKMQGGLAYAASVPSHVLGGRWFGDDDKIAAQTSQDVQVALKQIERAQTPSELKEAEEHLRIATLFGEHRTYRYHEDVYLGGDRTITGIKVGAVAATAVIAAPVLAGALGGGTLASLGVGGKLLVVGGTGLGTGLLTGTVGGAVESAHRGWRWENYGKGFADYAPVGLSYGTSFGLSALAQPGALPNLGNPARGALIDATASGVGGAADRGLHSGSAGEVLKAGGQGFVIGGATGAFGRAVDLKSPLARIGFGAGVSGAGAWWGGADADEAYRQALLGGGIATAVVASEQWSGAAPPVGRWLRPRAAALALRAGVGLSDVPGLGGRSQTPSLPSASVPTLVLNPIGQPGPPTPAATPSPGLADLALLPPRWQTVPVGQGTQPGPWRPAGLPDLGPPIVRWQAAPAGEEVFGQLAAELGTEAPGTVAVGRTRNRYPQFNPGDPNRVWAAVSEGGGLATTAQQQAQRLSQQLGGFPIPADRVLEAPWIGRIRNAAGDAGSSGTSAGWARSESAFWSAFRAQFPGDYALLGTGRTVTAALAERYGWPTEGPNSVVGQKLVHHHMENSSLVVALPESLHVNSSGAIHARPTVVGTP